VLRVQMASPVRNLCAGSAVKGIGWKRPGPRLRARKDLLRKGISMSLTQSQIEKKLSDENLDELLDLWRTEQGAEKRRDLDLMAAATPFPKNATLRVLDLGCGPGDVGRAVRARYPTSRIDCLDRDVFLMAICVAMNRRDGVSGQSFVRDLWASRADVERILAELYDFARDSNTVLSGPRIIETWACRPTA